MTNCFSADGFGAQLPDGLPVVYFSRLLVNKPYIASYVRSLQLFAYPGQEPDFRFSPIEPVPSRAEYECIVQSACCSEPESQKWLDDLLNGNEVAFIALLLVQLKNLDTLKLLAVPGPDRCPHLTRVIQRAAEPGRCGYLSKLKEVWVDEGPTWEDNKSGHSQLTLPRLVPFFHLPSIRRFKSWYISTAAFSDWQTGFFNRQPLVSNISFHHAAGIGLPPNLPDLISSCTRLESFEYIPDLWIDEGYNDTLDPSVLYSPLKHSISILETLSLRIDPRGVPGYSMAPNFQERRFFGPLSVFTALRNVQMRMCDLIPFCECSWEPASALMDILPASLEVLHITHVHTEALPYLVNNFSDMVRQRNSRLPILRSLVLVPLGIMEGSRVADWAEWYRGPDDVPQHIQNLVDEFAPKVLELTESFKNAGIKLEVISAARYVQQDFYNNFP